MELIDHFFFSVVLRSRLIIFRVKAFSYNLLV